ncbi:putative DNA glycosylase At3g47830 isoform X1 [Coffea arabica]|uniref:DNA glycosylase At3g47830 isoform X1 n=1 Tax=Coffea arabica TaxID=13443 RepID=A0ABM4U4Q5_COFAR
MKKGTKRKQPLNSSSSSSITKSLKRSKTIGIGNTEPYPDHPRPTPDECLAVRDALLALHGFPKEFLKYREQRLKKENPSFEKNSLKPEPPEKLHVEEKSDSSGKSEGEESVLDGLVSTILSQNTTDVNSQRAFLSLKSAFPTWEDVLAAEPNHIEDAIRCGGLAPTKASCIKSILNCLFEKRGKLCLEYLRDLSIGEVKAELSQFKGIGPKTVACVLMFHLQQNDFPVDTHARIKNMGQNSAISFLLSPARSCVDYFSCDTPVDNKRLKLFGFEIDSCQKSTTAPRSERDESVSSSDTVLSRRPTKIFQERVVYLLIHQRLYILGLMSCLKPQEILCVPLSFRSTNVNSVPRSSQTHRPLEVTRMLIERKG